MVAKYFSSTFPL